MSGAPLFSLKFKWPMFSSPALARDMLYIGSHEGKLFAIDLGRHELVWRFQTDASKRNGATYTNADGTPKYEAAMADDFYDETVQGIGKMMSVGAILSSPVVS
jgi:outer membrane protein assembly factor BamB